MGLKGSNGCCCGPCEVRDGCSNEFGLGGGLKPNHCCSCIPRAICVGLFRDGEYEPFRFAFLPWSCDEHGKYQGSVSCNGQTIDLSFAFLRDEYEDACYLCLESNALGLTYDRQGGGDNRACVPLGGDYNSLEEKKVRCRNMDVAFDFDWEGDYDGGTCGISRIEISPANYASRLPRRFAGNDDTNCSRYHRVCITVFDGTDEKTQYGCFVQYDNLWFVDIDGDSNKRVAVELVNDSPTELRLVSYLGNQLDPVEANCPTMYYRWEFYDGSWISVIGDPQSDCADCKCWCKNLCVTYSSQSSILKYVVEYDEDVGGWTIPLPGGDEILSLECSGCDPRITKLVFQGSERSILCPDQLSASSFPGVDGYGNSFSLSVECQHCGDECSQSGSTTCLPNRNTPIPFVLYGTIENITDCEDIDGVVVPLVYENPDVPNDKWNNHNQPNLPGECTPRLCLTCGEGNGDFRMTNGQICESGTLVPANVISEDPLILEFTLGPGEGCCDPSVNGVFKVTVTE